MYTTWNTFSEEMHEAFRQACLAWVGSGRPRFGYYMYSDMMKRTRALLGRVALGAQWPIVFP